MKSFYELWNILEDASSAPAGTTNQEIYNQLVKTIDAWRDQTLQDLQNKTKEFKQPSLWQRFKGGIQNLWYGRDNVKNPMYNQNAYGHGWGQDQKAECVEKLSTLFENAQKEVDDFFMGLNEEADASAPAADNLKIFNFIKDAAEKLKKEVQKALGLAAADPVPAPTTTPAPTS